MSNNRPPANSQVSLEQLACSVRTRLKAMLEADASKVDIAMAIGDLANEAADIVGHGQYGKWIKAAGLTLRTAFDYRFLAANRTRVETFRQRAADFQKAFSIRSVLKELRPKEDKPKRPEKLAEIETATALGPFLEGCPDLFWAALQLAPGLQAQIKQRLQPDSSVATVQSLEMTRVAEQARAILELLKHPTQPNVETAREKAARIVRLIDPPGSLKPVPALPVCNSKLDRGAFGKALCIEADLDIPDFLKRNLATVH